MQALPIYDQPHAEWLGEVYLPITPENTKLIVMRINDNPNRTTDTSSDAPDSPPAIIFGDPSEHELSDWDAIRLTERPWMLFQWLDCGMAAFIPYEKCQLYLKDRIRTYDIEDIEIAAPKFPVDGVPEGTECFVVHLRYW